MNVDTDTFSAITAVSAMLRKHAERAAPGRHRRPRRQRQPGEHPNPDRGMDRWWRGGYAAAMGDVVAVMGETPGMCDEALTAADDRVRRAALRAVLAVAEGAVELYNAEGVPAEWSSR